MKRLLVYQLIFVLIATLSWSFIGWSRDVASDNFESYSIDSYPSLFWYNLFSGSSAKISSTYGIWGSRSFRLEGNPSWSRIDAHDLTYNNRITYQSWVYIPNSSRGAMVGFFEKQSNQAPAYNTIMFDNNGRIVIRDSGYSDTDLQAYSANQWYLVIVAIDFNQNKMDVYINGTKKYSGSPRSSRSHCNIFGLETNNFSGSGTAVAYFDNVWFIDDAVVTKEYHSSISTIGSFSQTPYIAGRDGKYAEVKLEFPNGFTNPSDAILYYSHWYSQASGSVTGKIYISTSQQVTPPSSSNDWETFWVGNATNLGTYVGSFTATNTMIDATVNISSYVQSHPSNYYYIAINNEAYNDIGVYVLYIEGKQSGSSAHQCLYIESVADPAISSILNELGFSVTTSATIPSDLSSYDLVICREYSACTPSTADYVGNYVKSGGGAILMGGTPSKFGGGGYSCINISEWFGTSQYSNVGVSDAKVSFNNPLGTSLVRNDVIERCTGWGGAAVKDVVSDATILSELDYSTGNIHSYIRSYQVGRVAFWAGDASYNSKTRELFKAVCQWTGNTKYNCLYVVDTPDPTISSILGELGFRVTTSTIIPSDLSSYDLVICREYSACTPSTADYVGNYVKSGGGAILMGGTPSKFGGGGWSCSNISDWFGTSQYSNVDVSDAKVSFNNPLATSLVRNDVIEHCTGWGGAAVKDVVSDATILSEWDYSTGNIHSFIRSYQDGRVAFWAGDASYNSKTRELFKAVCQWTNPRTSVSDFNNNIIPNLFSLSQNFPNPFNPKTTIEFGIAKSGQVKIVVWNILGQLVAEPIDKYYEAGSYKIIFDASNLNSGVYFYKIETENYVAVKKMILTK